MKRAPAVLTATVAGVAATLGFHAHSKVPAATASSTPAVSISGSKTVTSEAISTRYGDVQVKVTISGGKITDVQAVQLPETDPKSEQISSYSAPQLRQGALSAQSAGIDVVSGATYTSDGYRQALQSALDKAGFSSASSASAG